MRVEWAMACRTLHLSEGGDAAAEGMAIDTLTVASLPHDIELVSLARVACTADECGYPHQFECYLMGPALSSVETLEFELTVNTPPPEHPEGWEVKVFLPIVARFIADREGPHGLDIWIDGRFRWQVPFRVLLRRPGSEPG